MTDLKKQEAGTNNRNHGQKGSSAAHTVFQVIVSFVVMLLPALLSAVALILLVAAGMPYNLIGLVVLSLIIYAVFFMLLMWLAGKLEGLLFK